MIYQQVILRYFAGLQVATVHKPEIYQWKTNFCTFLNNQYEGELQQVPGL